MPAPNYPLGVITDADTTGPHHRTPSGVGLLYGNHGDGSNYALSSVSPGTDSPGAWLRRCQAISGARRTGTGAGTDAAPPPIIPEGQSMSADFPPDNPDDAARWVVRHKGESEAVLHRWRAALGAAWAGGWPAVRRFTPHVIGLIANPEVLYLAAHRLRGNGPKAPGPDEVRLHRLGDDELRGLARALAPALATDTYRPGKERVKWVPKASGTGSRPIVVMNGRDRVVQKAAALVLRPMLDPLFDPLSFAYRPWRKREQAVAVAEQLAVGGYPVWLTHDLRDAYGRVPVSRLLDVFTKLLPCDRLRGFLALVLPPQSPSLGGIKQGGPLSPIALEVYLYHFLDTPWRRTGLDVRVIRYADDLLLTARSAGDAAAADALARNLMTPAGMLLKDPLADAETDLRTSEGGTEWLGYRFRLASTGFQIHLGSRALDRLGQRLHLAHMKTRPSRRASQVLRAWFGQLGPCYRWEDAAAVCRSAIATATAYGFEEVPQMGDLSRLWSAAAGRWQATRRAVRKNPGYLRAGPLTPPSPTSVVW